MSADVKQRVKELLLADWQVSQLPDANKGKPRLTQFEWRAASIKSDDILRLYLGDVIDAVKDTVPRPAPGDHNFHWRAEGATHLRLFIRAELLEKCRELANSDFAGVKFNDYSIAARVR